MLNRNTRVTYSMTMIVVQYSEQFIIMAITFFIHGHFLCMTEYLWQTRSRDRFCHGYMYSGNGRIW